MKFWKIFSAVVFAFFSVTLVVNSATTNHKLNVRTSNASDAKDLYTQHCASCHGADGRGQTEQGREYDVPDISSARFQRRHSDAKIAKAIAKGGGGMPAYDKKLSQNEITQLVKYVRTLKNP